MQSQSVYFIWVQRLFTVKTCGSPRPDLKLLQNKWAYYPIVATFSFNSSFTQPVNRAYDLFCAQIFLRERPWCILCYVGFCSVYFHGHIICWSYWPKRFETNKVLQIWLQGLISMVLSVYYFCQGFIVRFIDYLQGFYIM